MNSFHELFDLNDSFPSGVKFGWYISLPLSTRIYHLPLYTLDQLYLLSPNLYSLTPLYSLHPYISSASLFSQSVISSLSQSLLSLHVYIICLYLLSTSYIFSLPISTHLLHSTLSLSPHVYIICLSLLLTSYIVSLPISTHLLHSTISLSTLSLSPYHNIISNSLYIPSIATPPTSCSCHSQP